ncbi:hypothetical protein DMN91_003937 [Ooceraea biroi]|uniref:Salivary secreted peptide n=1 Tax=Ooceraea biroi TaxID=2015173 RepID=A0A026W6T2_OOCBI|nr:probable salivary secreted peptide [Ooceraea biroi]EZA51817.1 hypothetical protein X777_09574 [Ooceraea biroi]RLU23731.1 hypothetical protein DMN91_003937 [Ooceraea biroi]
MSAQKYVIGLAFLVAVLLTINAVPASGTIDNHAAAVNKSHHLIVGNRRSGDRLVLRQNVQKNPSHIIVTYTKTFNVSRSENITMVKALDKMTNGNGAYASILRGGPGYSNVTIKFRSKRRYGINFVVELYAH